MSALFSLPELTHVLRGGGGGGGGRAGPASEERKSRSTQPLMLCVEQGENQIVLLTWVGNH
jgi:hypothetical protein